MTSKRVSPLAVSADIHKRRKQTNDVAMSDIQTKLCFSPTCAETAGLFSDLADLEIEPASPASSQPPSPESDELSDPLASPVGYSPTPPLPDFECSSPSSPSSPLVCCPSTPSDRYERVRTLMPKTHFGKVELRLDTTQQSHVVCKLSNKAKAQAALLKDYQEDVHEEARLLAELNHPNIIKLLSFEEDDTNLWTILEYADGGDIFEAIKTTGPLALPQARHHFRQMLQAVNFVHDRRLAHLDLSLENFFVRTEHGALVVKLGDFGMAKEFTTNAGGQQTVLFENVSPGKPGYQAPEIFSPAKFAGRDVDMFAMGVCLFIMLTGTPPFSRAKRRDPCWRQIIRGKFATTVQKWGLTPLLPPPAFSLISQLLSPCPADRPSAQAALQHSFFQGDFV